MEMALKARPANFQVQRAHLSGCNGGGSCRRGFLPSSRGGRSRSSCTTRACQDVRQSAMFGRHVDCVHSDSPSEASSTGCTAEVPTVKMAYMTYLSIESTQRQIRC